MVEVAEAGVYVVDQAVPGAADTNPGTEEMPFKTVQHAADVARPGDTVYVMAGRYDERVKVTRGGTKGNPVAFLAMPRRSATVSGFDFEADYIRVEGFEITADRPGTAVQLGGSHCEILDNYIHHMKTAVNGTYGEPSPDGATRDYSAVAHNQIAYNKEQHLRRNHVVWRGAAGQGIDQRADPQQRLLRRETGRPRRRRGLLCGPPGRRVQPGPDVISHCPFGKR